MKLKLGDQVRFINERQEGRVTRFFDEGMIGVTTSDDFEIPVLASEVVRVDKAEKTIHQENAEENEYGAEDDSLHGGRVPMHSQGLSLALVPDEALPSLLRQYLINTSDFQVLANIYTEKKKAFNFHWAGVLASQQQVLLQTFSLADLDTWPTFHFQIIYFHRGSYTPMAPRTQELSLKAKHFSGSKKPIPLLNARGFLFSLDEEVFRVDGELLKEKFFTAENRPFSLQKPPEEVDLHFEKLDSYRSDLPKQDILKLQLAHFNHSFDAAIANGMNKITFIHGQGNGVLRYEIHKRISNNPLVKTFKDAGKDAFGYGATEVFLH